MIKGLAVPTNYRHMDGAKLTCQFMGLNYDVLAYLTDALDDATRLIKVLQKFLTKLRTTLPVWHQAQIIFGNVPTCGDFAWMLPSIRCIIDSKLETYIEKLINTLEEEADLSKPKLSG